MIDIFGYIAGTLTTACFIPQAYKIISTKNVDGISLPMYLIFLSGVLMWLVYGLSISNGPMIVFNLLTAALTIVIIYNIIRYRK
jgi:MtN3 and saliva related transmembrane protein